MPSDTYPPLRYACGSSGSRAVPPLGTPRPGRAANTPPPPTLPPTPPTPPPTPQVLTDSWGVDHIRTDCSCPPPPRGLQPRTPSSTNTVKCANSEVPNRQPTPSSCPPPPPRPTQTLPSHNGTTFCAQAVCDMTHRMGRCRLWRGRRRYQLRLSSTGWVAIPLAASARRAIPHTCQSRNIKGSMQETCR